MKDLKQQEHDQTIARPERYGDFVSAYNYDHAFHFPTLLRRLSHLLEMSTFRRALSRIKGKSVLDAPCGTGRIHELLSEKFSTVVSLDSSESMLHVYRYNTPGTRLCCGDIFHLPFPDNMFDWVVCYRLFHHMHTHQSRITLLQNMMQVSKTGVLFTAWIDTPFNRRRGSRRQSLPRKRLEGLVREANLRLVHVDYVSWPFQPKSVITCGKM